MDHVKVLKRAWHTVWRYRALWVFGIILALTTAGGINSGAQYSFRGEDFSPGGEFHIEEISPEVVSTLIAIGLGLACVIVILIIAAKIARYVGETALIRMVDDYEERGKQHSVRQGFRMGWSRTAWRLFLIDLLIDLPAALAFLLLFVLVLAPLLLWIKGSTVAGVIGTVSTIGLFFLVVFLAIIVGVALSLLKHFFRRACTLDELGVTESIRRGYAVVRQHLKDVGLMWLIMVGVRLGWLIAMVPIVVLLMSVGVVLGGASALLVGGLAGLVMGGATPWILAGALGIPIFILVLVAPLALLGGLREVFLSSVWTLTYRELRALENLEPGQLPELDPSGLEVAPIA